jgi:hypothetical protein
MPMGIECVEQLIHWRRGGDICLLSRCSKMPVVKIQKIISLKTHFSLSFFPLAVTVSTMMGFAPGAIGGEFDYRRRHSLAWSAIRDYAVRTDKLGVRTVTQ